MFKLSTASIQEFAKLQLPQEFIEWHIKYTTWLSKEVNIRLGCIEWQRKFGLASISRMNDDQKKAYGLQLAKGKGVAQEKADWQAELAEMVECLKKDELPSISSNNIVPGFDTIKVCELNMEKQVMKHVYRDTAKDNFKVSDMELNSLIFLFKHISKFVKQFEKTEKTIVLHPTNKPVSKSEFAKIDWPKMQLRMDDICADRGVESIFEKLNLIVFDKKVTQEEIQNAYDLEMKAQKENFGEPASSDEEDSEAKKTKNLVVTKGAAHKELSQDEIFEIIKTS